MNNTSKAQYVLGFIFNSRGTEVKLIKKSKPDWQRDKYNGIGGKIEDGETPIQAMMREAEEEAGIPSLAVEWRNFASFGDDAGNYYVECFCMFSTELYNRVEHQNRQEPIESFMANDGSIGFLFPTIPNVPWLIAMAKSFQRGESCQKFQIWEIQ